MNSFLFTVAKGGGGFMFFLFFVVWVVSAVGLWKIFEKAGKPGWGAFIPIYNLILWLEIVRRPGWWIILIYIVPIANIICLFIVIFDLAKSYGKGVGYGLGLLFLPLIFFPMLGFSDAVYTPLEREIVVQT